ncbi:hypothetical protein BDV95DRAFT_588453 [Massariosphaeria phaeospora]|uniref:Uncharacterized protein n=1 Tax=Massariosphaeria phaeospora TaxID=100035 RepID=A0A7C8HYB7_9PLEO|nr:hypothetical protein BDV95DRAFT_588453 [Massariosphaeria phaeospora]
MSEDSSATTGSSRSENGAPKVHRKPVAKKPSTGLMSDFTPHAFIATTVLATTLYSWPLRWIISGAPLLVYSVLLGNSKGYRIMPWLPIWTMFATINLAYAVAATSWLLYWVFASICYPALILSCLFQFDAAANLGRRAFRKVLRNMHFIQDTVSFFGIPALELDKDVLGLFVVRGLDFSLSTLTATAHGCEVGVRLTEDMELAIQVDKVVVHLFRKIEISDVYANVKGGELEMTFGTFQPDESKRRDNAFIARDTDILKAAAAAVADSQPSAKEVQSNMTGGKVPKTSSDPGKSLESTISLSMDEEGAREKYTQIVQHISETSRINMATEMLKTAERPDNDNGLLDTANGLRAAICTVLHTQPSVPHPPSTSIRLSTLRETSAPNFKLFYHRFPLLYRLLLNPISYFHPVFIDSVTIAGSGKWMVSLMKHHLFKHYSTQESEIGRLEKRISTWLADANFAVGLGKLYCTAQVPVNTAYEIECKFKVDDVMAHRSLPDASELTQVVRLGGADATVALPAFLLPRHEHLLPPKPTDYAIMEMEQAIREAESKPKTVQLKRALKRFQNDETDMKVSAHGHLPAVFDQELLNFVAALIKATKVIEYEKDHEELLLKRAATENPDLIEPIKRTDSIASEASTITTDTSASTSTSTTAATTDSAQGQMAAPSSTKGFNKFIRKMDRGVKDGWRKAGISTVNAMANDRWIAKLVGNFMRKMERAQGDVGYSGLVPISLAIYREKGEEATKILP